MSALFATPLAAHQIHPNRTYPTQQRPAAKQHRQQLQKQFQQLQQQQQQQPQPVFPSPPPSLYNDENIASGLAAQNLFPLPADQPPFDFTQQDFSTTASPSLMPADPTSSAWLSSGQLTPTSSSRTHHRASSLSSLGSVGPASPFAGNTSNPQVAGDLYHDYQSMASTYLPHEHHHNKQQPLTPEHTPLQEQFLSPNYAFYSASAPPPQPPQHSNLKRVAGDESAAERQQKIAYRSAMPKLDRTMSDAYRDELYNPNLQFATAAPSTQVLAAAMPQNDIFAQRLQAANTQHLSASHRAPLSGPSRERSPFRQGSPLAPTGPGNAFVRQQPGGVMFGTASHLREQQKAENARAMQEQFERSPEHIVPKTISPKDVDLVYHETEADAKTPLFAQPPHPADLDDVASQQSFGSMATSRRESMSASAYSGSSHATQQPQFNFAPPAVPGSVRPLPQQYPFTSQAPRKPSEVSNHTEDFPATIASMESSGSEYAPDNGRKRRAAADTGTYTCTYHGCTLRFDTPALLQRHKREGHRGAGAWISAAGDERGMTSAAARNTQEGPHRCERINPSTGKPCNTVFSRPYDLTRHEDTIHNARKQKVRCHLCTEDKSFSRNDALTRHFRVCHPDHVDPSRKRRGGR